MPEVTRTEQATEWSVTDELSAKIAAWQARASTLYASSPAAGEVRATVVSVQGLPQGKSFFWVAHTAGQAAETGAPAAGRARGGAGGQSWAAQPVSLRVYDPAADLTLFLCERGEGGARRCVGRVVVPMTQLLPLNPLRSPRPLEVWATVFPPAAEYDAARGVHAKLLERHPAVPGLGMAAGDHPRATWPGEMAQALIRIELILSRSLLGVYLLQPPFDPLGGPAEPSVDEATSQRAVAPALVQAAEARLLSCVLQPPAALRLAHKQPWLGYVLAGMLWPPCFGMPAAWWPWWALVLWLINGVAYGWLRSTSAALGLAPKRVLVPWEPPPPPPAPAARASNVDEASAAERLASLQLLAEAQHARFAALASIVERAITAPAFADPRAATLLVLPLLAATAVASFACGLLGLIASLVGGLGGLIFSAGLIAALTNSALYYKKEIFEWAGASLPRRRPSADGLPDDINGISSSRLLPPGSLDSATSGLTADQLEVARAAQAQAARAAEATASAAGKALAKSLSVVRNLCGRVPDEQEEAHRAIALAAMRRAERVDEGEGEEGLLGA